MKRIRVVLVAAVLAGTVGGGVCAEAFDLAGRKARLGWIWERPKLREVPEGSGATEVDRFLEAGMRERGLRMAGAVDARTWLRRVSFVVTGLPPGLEEVETFAGDASREARERVVDGMLASPHFGERWARHWMDVMRYAESRGHEDDFGIANAWRYRDYLIRAFNADVPYDRLVKEHLAGDLLVPRRGPGGENESVQGTGWAFLGEEVHNPVDIRQDECERIDNKIDVLSKAFLGLTVACARCHDHKFDAVTQRDYYALSGVVQGAAFRQVRYETMESHGETAGKVVALRAEQGPRMLMAMGKELRGKVERVDGVLLAARRVLFGEALETVAGETGFDAAVVGGWLGAVKAAVAGGGGGAGESAAWRGDADA